MTAFPFLKIFGVCYVKALNIIHHVNKPIDRVWKQHIFVEPIEFCHQIHHIEFREEMVNVLKRQQTDQKGKNSR